MKSQEFNSILKSIKRNRYVQLNDGIIRRICKGDKFTLITTDRHDRFKLGRYRYPSQYIVLNLSALSKLIVYPTNLAELLRCIEKALTNIEDRFDARPMQSAISYDLNYYVIKDYWEYLIDIPYGLPLDALVSDGSCFETNSPEVGYPGGSESIIYADNFTPTDHLYMWLVGIIGILDYCLGCTQKCPVRVTSYFYEEVIQQITSRLKSLLKRLEEVM